MLRALERSGCTIIHEPARNVAPFRIVFDTPAGERIGVVAYAFLANSEITKNRPPDEWRFQIKYGSQFDKLHPVWIDPHGLYTTIFLGISPERDFFVGADPVVHNPTRFSVSLEFKASHVAAIEKHGWCAWQRESHSRDGDEIEVLVGGKRDRFLQFIRFERAAAGLDTGHRQMLAEKWLGDPSPTSHGLVVAPPPAQLHALSLELEMSESAVLDMINSARRLKMAVRGWVAEEHLVKRLAEVPGVSECERLDIEGGADVRLRFEGGRPLEIQCKNVLRERMADGTVRMDFQKTRVSKGDPCSRYYRPDDFDLIAGCMHAVTEKWEYRYVLPGRLDRHKKCTERLGNNVRIDNRWSADARSVLAEISR